MNGVTPREPDDPFVYIVDDDPAVQKSLERLLRAGGYRTRGFVCARTFLSQCTDRMAGCLILDVAMPEMDGMRLHEILADSCCSLPVLFLTGHGDIPMSVRAIKRGAMDFLTKPVQDRDLLDAVKRAMEMNRQAWAQRSLLDDIHRRLKNLTSRERDVLDGVVRGKLNKQIADDLGISLKTVKVHRGRVMEKMKADSLAELVQLCIAAGIVELQAGAGPSLHLAGEHS